MAGNAKKAAAAAQKVNEVLRTLGIAVGVDGQGEFADVISGHHGAQY
jgi:hypothetical protein